MERAAQVLQKTKQSRPILDHNQAVQAIWPVAVGEPIARHVTRLKLVRTTIVVEVEDAVWQRQLRTLESQILSRVQLLLPDIPVTGMEFRIGVPRREPQRASAPLSPAPECGDEAERIADPVLKKVYQLSRRKASA